MGKQECEGKLPDNILVKRQAHWAAATEAGISKWSEKTEAH